MKNYLRDPISNGNKYDEPDEEQFGQEGRIVLASAEFSIELTTSVMWLHDYGLVIRCVRMHSYASGGQTFLDVQTIIPIPEVADNQVRIRDKKQKERESRKISPDFTKYDVRIVGEQYPSQSKRWMMFQLISGILSNGGSPQQIMDAIPWRKSLLFLAFDGTLDEEQGHDQIMQTEKSPGSNFFSAMMANSFTSTEKPMS